MDGLKPVRIRVLYSPPFKTNKHMTYKQFKKIWNAQRWPVIKNPRIIDTGSSQHLIDELIKVADGKPSAFDTVKLK
jgi:hypothetical protein